MGCRKFSQVCPPGSDRCLVPQDRSLSDHPPKNGPVRCQLSPPVDRDRFVVVIYYHSKIIWSKLLGYTTYYVTMYDADSSIISTVTVCLDNLRLHIESTYCDYDSMLDKVSDRCVGTTIKLWRVSYIFVEETHPTMSPKTLRRLYNSWTSRAVV